MTTQELITKLNELADLQDKATPGPLKHCPICGSDNVEYQELEEPGETFFRKVKKQVYCNSCDFRYRHPECIAWWNGPRPLEDKYRTAPFREAAEALENAKEECADLAHAQANESNLKQDAVEWTARVGALTKERDQLRTELTKWQRIRTPTHGSCCTCHKCGLPYGECRCDLDELADENQQLSAELAQAKAEAERLRLQCYTLEKGGDILKEQLEQAKAEIESLEGANLPLYSDRIKDLEKHLAQAQAENESLNQRLEAMADHID